MIAILAFCCAMAAEPAWSDGLSARPLIELQAEEAGEHDEVTPRASVRALKPFVHAEPCIAIRLADAHRDALLDTMRLNI